MNMEVTFFIERLPRIRGDRPFAALVWRHGGWATPHTRGSTDWQVLGYPSNRGYPAYAGIDRRRTWGGYYAGRLPRIRGDRPRIGSFAPTVGSATPHTRGSTVVYS